MSEKNTSTTAILQQGNLVLKKQYYGNDFEACNFIVSNTKSMWGIFDIIVFGITLILAYLVCYI